MGAFRKLVGIIIGFYGVSQVISAVLFFVMSKDLLAPVSFIPISQEMTVSSLFMIVVVIRIVVGLVIIWVARIVYGSDKKNVDYARKR